MMALSTISFSVHSRFSATFPKKSSRPYLKGWAIYCGAESAAAAAMTDGASSFTWRRRRSSACKRGGCGLAACFADRISSPSKTWSERGRRTLMASTSASSAGRMAVCECWLPPHCSSICVMFAACLFARMLRDTACWSIRNGAMLDCSLCVYQAGSLLRATKVREDLQASAFKSHIVWICRADVLRTRSHGLWDLEGLELFQRVWQRGICHQILSSSVDNAKCQVRGTNL